MYHGGQQNYKITSLTVKLRNVIGMICSAEIHACVVLCCVVLCCVVLCCVVLCCVVLCCAVCAVFTFPMCKHENAPLCNLM